MAEDIDPARELPISFPGNGLMREGPRRVASRCPWRRSVGAVVQKHFFRGRHDRIQRIPGGEGGTARKFLAQPADEFLFPGRRRAGRETLLPVLIDQPGLQHHLRHLLGGLVQEPENLRGAQIVFGPAFAQKPFHESLLSRGQQPVRKAGLDFRRTKIKLEDPLARVAPERGRDILDGAMRESEFHRGAGAKPLAIGAIFALRNRGGKTAPQPGAVAQHSRSQPRRAVDRAFRIGR